MELPRNTTQVGELHGSYRVFIEDYVISYIKQLCRQKPEQRKRVAFYGRLQKEDALWYFFLYGAGEVICHEDGAGPLTGRDYEEIVWMGGSHFEQYIPLGYATIEDFFTDEIILFIEGREFPVRGYHIFYEKNDTMLAFMIHNQAKESRAENRLESKPGNGSENGLANKPGSKSGSRPGNKPGSRLENKWADSGTQEQEPIKLTGILKSAVAALFIVLCVTAVSTMNGLGKLTDMRDFFQKAFQTMAGQNSALPAGSTGLPVSSETVISGNEAETRILFPEQAGENNSEKEKNQEQGAQEQTAQEPEASPTEKTDIAAGTESAEIIETTETVATTVPQTEIREHIIQKGDTLIGISRFYYGGEDHVQEICEKNGIKDSDHIQIGQKILLP